MLKVFVALATSSCCALDMHSPPHANLKLRSSTPSANALLAKEILTGAKSNLTSMAVMVQSLAGCQCKFKNVCTCESTLQFMSCIENACNSNKCACQDFHYLEACNTMKAGCPNVGLVCSAGGAVCSGAATPRRTASPAPAPVVQSIASPSPFPAAPTQIMKSKAIGAEGGKGAEGRKSEEGSSLFHTGHVLALGLFASVTIIALTFAMVSSSDKKVSTFTWLALDQIVAIFVAVMMFQAVDDLVADSGILKQSHMVVCLWVYSMVLLGLAIGVSYLLTNRPIHLAVFCGASAHFVSFASMHSAVEIVKHHFSSSTLYCFLGVLAVLVGTILVYIAAYQLKKVLGITKNDELMDKVDDVETDFGAMALGIVWTVFVMFVISGSLQDVEDVEENPSASERSIILWYAVGMLVACGGILYSMSKLKPARSYVAQRARNFATSFISIAVAWGFIFWTKSEIRATGATSDKLVFHLLTAFVVSLVAMVIVWATAKGSRNTLASREMGLVVSMIALVVGWSWEETFDEGLESISEDSKTMKMGVALLLTGLILPVYVGYLKPTVINVTEEA